MNKFWVGLNETLRDLLISILAYGIVAQIIVMWFVPDISKYSIGLWIGIADAMFGAWHMWWSIDRNLTIHADDEKGANAASLKGSIIRYAVTIIILICVCLTDFAYPLATFAGMLGLKIGAYLAPYTGNFFKNK